MNKPVTQEVVRRFLLEAINAPTVRAEQEAWNTVLGTAPLWSLAAVYCNTRRHACDAIRKGFDKSGATVIAFIEALKDRAPGPREPEVYRIPDTCALAYVWRTSEGSKAVVLERAPKIEPPPGGGPPPAEIWWHWPDQWRQVKVQPKGDGTNMLALFIGGGFVAWQIPSPKFTDDSVEVLPFSDRLSTPCTDPGCEADVAECGHKSMAQELGADLPAGPGRVRCGPCTSKGNAATEVLHAPPACDHPSVKPCGSCGNVKCREDGEMVCRFPGCSENPAQRADNALGYLAEALTPLEHPDGSPEHEFATANLQERAKGYREAAERSRRVREDLALGPNPPALMGDSDPECPECQGSRCLEVDCAHGACNHDGSDRAGHCPPCPACSANAKPESANDPEWVCGVCEGIDPESSDAPNSGHAWECPIGDKKLAEGYADVDASNGKKVDQDPAGPIFYDSNGPEPSNGWTNTPVDPGDPRLGQRVDSESPVLDGVAGGRACCANTDCEHRWDFTDPEDTGRGPEVCPKCGGRTMSLTWDGCPHARWVERDGVNRCARCGIVEDTSPLPDPDAVCNTLGGHDGPCNAQCFEDLDETDAKLAEETCTEQHPKTNKRCEEKPEHLFTHGYKGPDGDRIWWDRKPTIKNVPQGKIHGQFIEDPNMPPGMLLAVDDKGKVAGVMVNVATDTTSEEATPGPLPEAPATSATGDGNDPSGEPEGGHWDGTGIMPDAKCTACDHTGQEHDHRTKRCARCRDCPGFNAARQCQRSWEAHNGACGAPDCVALDRCKCGCARETHSRPNDGCSRCPCVVFRVGEREALVTEEMEADAIQSRKFRFAGDLDMTKVRKQRKTKKGNKCCELCLKAVKEGDEWVARLGRSVNKRAHLACADEVALEMADAREKE